MRQQRQTAAFFIGLGFVIWYSPASVNAQVNTAFGQNVTADNASGTTGDYDLATDEALFLLVSINGRDTGIIAEFALSQQSQRMSAHRTALELVGIAAPQNLGRSIFLDEIPALTFVYDVAAQILFITVSGAAQIPVAISAAQQKEVLAPQAGYGLVLNYRVTTNLGDDIFGDGFQATDAFAAIDLRAYTPFGVLTNTGAAGIRNNGSGSANFTRYNTYFTASSPSRLVTLTIGDFTTSGLAWTRPVRLGGAQVRRDFSLRDDIVTTPLLSFSATAAVPSSIDVYVDNVRAYSGAVDAGPFKLSDVPMITRGGEAVFVMRDAAGQEQITTVPFFATQNLLRKSMLDFSISAGRPRSSFGAGNVAYAVSDAAAVSLRYGLSDKLTIGGHAEGIDDLIMAGVGIDTVLFNRAEISLAGGASTNRQSQGQFVFGTLRTEIAGVGVQLSTRRTFGNFEDLATVVVMGSLSENNVASVPGVLAQDALSLTLPAFTADGRLAMNLIHSRRTDRLNLIASLSYSQPLPWQAASLHGNAFMDFAGDGAAGISVGVSIPLGRTSFATASLQRDQGGQTGAVTGLSRMADRAPGSYGYNVNLSEQAKTLGATYQTGVGRAGVALRDSGSGTSASMTFEGAAILAGGGLFASNRIDDGFAVVDVGVRDIPVSLNNAEVAITGSQGKALVSDLLSYRLNRVSINTLDLPLDASISASAINVVPARQSGVFVDFGGQPTAAALVALRDLSGQFLSPGTQVRLQHTGANFIVGYDGEVWIEGLEQQNRLLVQTGDNTCRASFTYTAQPGVQAYIEEVTCL